MKGMLKGSILSNNLQWESNLVQKTTQYRSNFTSSETHGLTSQKGKQASVTWGLLFSLKSFNLLIANFY
jgi:hypothetical protein